MYLIQSDLTRISTWPIPTWPEVTTGQVWIWGLADLAHTRPIAIPSCSLFFIKYHNNQEVMEPSQIMFILSPFQLKR